MLDACWFGGTLNISYIGKGGARMRGHIWSVSVRCFDEVAAITAYNHSTAGHSGVGMASSCVNSLCSVTGKPGLGHIMNESVLQHWVLEVHGWWKPKTGLKCTKSEISVWKILPFIRGYKFLSEGLTPFLLMPCQHESSLVRNRPDNSAHRIINTTQLCLGRELFWVLVKTLFRISGCQLLLFLVNHIFHNSHVLGHPWWSSG